MRVNIYVDTSTYEVDAARPEVDELLSYVLGSVRNRVLLGETAGTIRFTYFSVDNRWEQRAIADFDIVDDNGWPVTKVGE